MMIISNDRWASTNERYKNGHPFLHEQLARSYRDLEEYSLAQRHYIKAHQPREYALMLVAWAHSGYKSEQDLFLARGVLLYLGVGNLKDAKVVYQIFVDSLPSFQATPLVNFLKLLLLTLESKTYTVFDVLRKKYKVSLARDPFFNQYLDHIAQLYYSKKPTNTGGIGNFISDLFSNFMSNDIELGAALRPFP